MRALTRGWRSRRRRGDDLNLKVEASCNFLEDFVTLTVLVDDLEQIPSRVIIEMLLAGISTCLHGCLRELLTLFRKVRSTCSFIFMTLLQSVWLTGVVEVVGVLDALDEVLEARKRLVGHSFMCPHAWTKCLLQFEEL